ncbi:TPA: hypothetical protein ACNB2F_004757 [Escherichia coli]
MKVINQLKKFDKKRTPDDGRISLLYENAIKYDMYSVYIKDKNDTEYLFDCLVDGKIKAFKWDDEERRFHISSFLDISEVTPDSFFGVYYYRAHELRFNSLNDLTFLRELFFRVKSNYENIKFSREKYIYRQQKKEITDVMFVLSTIIRMYREWDAQTVFSEFSIMTEVAGSLWVYHDDKNRMRKELRLCLNSLVQNGDLVETSSGFRPTGKALNTISTFNKDEVRYRENLSTQKKMFWATFFAAVGGVGSMIAAIIGLLK